MNSFRDILRSKLAQVTTERPAIDQKTLQFLFEKIIEREYGAQGKSNVVTLGFNDGVLVLGVYKSLWLTEITLVRDDLREKLNSEIGSEHVKSIRVQRK